MRAERVIVRHRDWVDDVVLPDPRELGFQEVLLLLRDRDFEGLRDKRISIWSIETIHNLWRAAYDLPEIDAAIRLAYVVDHYHDALVTDLQTHRHVDLETLWLERKWGRLLGLIDRLPSHTWYAQAVSEDQEHTALLAKQMAEAEVNGDEKERPSPPIHTWSPEVSILTDIFDAVMGLTHITKAINSKQEPPAPEPAPRPNANLSRAKAREVFRLRKEKHEALAARMLRNR